MTALIKDPQSICYIVQARLGSQRCLNKMIRPFYKEKTLLHILFDKLINSTLANIYLSAYEPEIKEIGNQYGIEIFDRSEKSAKSEGTPLTDIYEWYTLPYKYCVLISACNPLLSLETIENFASMYECTSYDGLFGVVKKQQYYWDSNGESITPLTEDVMNTKTAPITYEAAHCLYASRMDLIPQGRFMGDFSKNNPALFVIPEEESFDIDYEWQFQLGKTLYKNKLKFDQKT